MDIPNFILCTYEDGREEKLPIVELAIPTQEGNELKNKLCWSGSVYVSTKYLTLLCKDNNILNENVTIKFISTQSGVDKIYAYIQTGTTTYGPCILPVTGSAVLHVPFDAGEYKAIANAYSVDGEVSLSVSDQ